MLSLTLPSRPRRTTLTAVVLLVACLVAGLVTGTTHIASSWDRTEPRTTDVRMPSPPRDRGRWLAEVGRIYAHADGGRGAEAWLRSRMAHRHPGRRLAVVMGVDDVMVQTHFRGMGALVPPSVSFVRTAHALGYAVYYVTGRSYGTGLGRAESVLRRAHVPASGFCGRPATAADQAAGKARCRAAITRRGYDLAMVVGANRASFDGTPRPEQEIRLPDFSHARP